MYRRSKFVEILTEIREEMAHESDYDVVLFAEMIRSGGTDVPVRDRKRLVIAKPEAEPTDGGLPLRRTDDLVGK